LGLSAFVRRSSGRSSWRRPIERDPRGGNDAWLTKERILSELEEIQATPAAAFKALLEGNAAPDLGVIARALDLTPAELEALRSAFSCETPEQRAALIATLETQGIMTTAGRPLEEAVRVEVALPASIGEMSAGASG